MLKRVRNTREKKPPTMATFCTFTRSKRFVAALFLILAHLKSLLRLISRSLATIAVHVQQHVQFLAGKTKPRRTNDFLTIALKIGFSLECYTFHIS